MTRYKLSAQSNRPEPPRCLFTWPDPADRDWDHRCIFSEHHRLPHECACGAVWPEKKNPTRVDTVV